MKGLRLFPLLPLMLAGCSAGTGAARLETLDQSLDPLRAHFNAERGRPRVLALFSPT